MIPVVPRVTITLRLASLSHLWLQRDALWRNLRLVRQRTVKYAGKYSRDPPDIAYSECLR